MEKLNALEIKRQELVHRSQSRRTRDYRLLRNLFTSGSRYHVKKFDEQSEEINVSKEEIDMGVVYDYDGVFTKPLARLSRDRGPLYKFIYDYEVVVDQKSGDVRVKLTEADIRDNLKVRVKNGSPENEHTWVFPRHVIVNYLEDHPLNIYDQPRREGLIRRKIDDIILPLRQNNDQVISNNGCTDVVVDIYMDVETKLTKFVKNDEDTSINPLYRDAMDRAAWCWCLLTVFKNIRYDDYYGDKYDIITKLRSVDRFQDLVPGEEKAFAV